MGGILTMHVANGTRRYLNKCERTWANWKAKIRRKIVTRTAIVTGASRGIGAAVAERLAQDGFSAVMNYAGSEAEASALAKKIQHGGGRAITVKADVSKPVEVARMFDATEKEFGGVDVLVNNAGIMTLSSIATTDDGMFDRLVAVNLKGTFNGLREAAKRLRHGGRNSEF